MNHHQDTGNAAANLASADECKAPSAAECAALARHTRGSHRAVVEELFKKASRNRAVSYTHGQMRTLNLERLEAAFGPKTRALAELQMRVRPVGMTLAEFERQMREAFRDYLQQPNGNNPAGERHGPERT